jgi:hypothetical protein
MFACLAFASTYNIQRVLVWPISFGACHTKCWWGMAVIYEVLTLSSIVCVEYRATIYLATVQ